MAKTQKASPKSAPRKRAPRASSAIAPVKKVGASKKAVAVPKAKAMALKACETKAEKTRRDAEGKATRTLKEYPEWQDVDDFVKFSKVVNGKTLHKMMADCYESKPVQARLNKDETATFKRIFLAEEDEGEDMAGCADVLCFTKEDLQDSHVSHWLFIIYIYIYILVLY